MCRASAHRIARVAVTDQAGGIADAVAAARPGRIADAAPRRRLALAKLEGAVNHTCAVAASLALNHRLTRAADAVRASRDHSDCSVTDDNATRKYA